MNYFTTIVGIVSGVTILSAFVWKIFNVIKLFAEGQKCLLRSQMLATYYKCQKDQEIHQFELENFLKLYLAYKALGGNSFIDEVCADVKNFRVV